jgi:replicative DNA helicase
MGPITEAELTRIGEATKQIAAYPVFVMDSPDINPWLIQQHCYKLQSEQGLDVVLVDGAEFLEVDTPARDRGEVVKSLKKVAQRLQVPTVITWALPRGSWVSRQDKRPQWSDLPPGAGQAPDVRIGLYRDDLFHKHTDKPHIVEAIVLQQRHGPPGTIELGFTDGRIRDLASFSDETLEEADAAQAKRAADLDDIVF